MRFLTNKINAVQRNLQRVGGKTPRVVFVRGLQEMRLAYVAKTDGWKKIERSTTIRWNKKTAQHLQQRKRLTLLANDGFNALKSCISSKTITKKTLLHYGDAIKNKRFSILGSPLPLEKTWPWTKDWRYDKNWENKNFKQYTHHEDRDQPYDIKYPWELSRLQFLPALLQAALLNDSFDANKPQIHDVIEILQDWTIQNPLGHSVNWYPMEAAMRSISLVLVLDMLIATKTPPEELKIVLSMLSMHGLFLWRTIEDTDNRGNHYTANIVALLALGTALEEYEPEAKKWKNYALKNLAKEIMAQFTPDGVNFEMSTGYHRLVTELFLIATHILTKQNLRDTYISKPAQERLHKACLYTAQYTRPDGYAPIIGDCDDASVFALDKKDHRDHSIIIGMGSILFDDQLLKSLYNNHPLTEQTPTLIPWLFGQNAVKELAQPATNDFHTTGEYFAQGGIVIAKSQAHYLFMDAGPVGQNGVGGHGHNDILSFELVLDQQPVIVDAGCYIYSGDKAERQRFRSTTAHNGLMLDDEELCRFAGPFRMLNDARPLNVRVKETEGVWHIEAAHTGYQRLYPPASHKRHVIFDSNCGTFYCTDTVSCSTTRNAVRFLHFAPDIDITEHDKNSFLLKNSKNNKKYVLEYDENSQATIIDDWISTSYGQKTASKTLKLISKITPSETQPLTIHIQCLTP